MNVIQPQGGINEAEYYIHTGVNANTRLLSYSPDDYAFWMISSADTVGYTTGNEITIRLQWTSQYTLGETRWQIELASLNDDDIIDPTFSIYRLLPLSSCSTNQYGITTVEYTFTPNIDELQNKKPSILKLSRYSNDDTGDVIGNDVLLFSADIAYNLPAVDPTFTTVSGASEETSNIDFTYNILGLVETATETLIDGTTIRTFEFTYTADGQFNVITMTTDSHVFTETYTYNGLGQVENISTTFVEL
jgi:hypothetical protein